MIMLGVAFLDARKVFDIISHWKLFKKLIDRQIPLYLVEILYYNWYQHQEMTVECISISNSFNATNGVRHRVGNRLLLQVLSAG